MIIFLVLFFLLTVFLSGITFIPLSVAFVSAVSVVFKKPVLFFIVFLLGFFLDLIYLRPLGQTGLFFVFFVLLIWLYEGKFETQTLIFVLISSFLGSLIYLKIFEGSFMFLTALINALLAIFVFKMLVGREMLKEG